MRSPTQPLFCRVRPGIAAAVGACWFAGLLGLLALPAVGFAQESTPPPLAPVETPPPRATPRPVPTPEPAAEEAPTPTPTPRVHTPRPSATPSDEPVAVVNGSPVYRPLFRSIVNDPVDRALALQEFRHRGLTLPPGAVDQAMRYHTNAAFGDEAKLNGQLQKLGATMDDYRAFMGEEARLNAMLGVVTKSGRTEAERKTLRDNWLAGLRAKATVNKPKKA